MIPRLVSAARRRVERVLHPGRPVVLMYHRIADIEHDPWNLSVSPSLFAEQIAALCTVRTVVPLEKISTARSDRPLAAVTFDDGYADVVDNALPVLDRHGCPATLFVVAGTFRGRTGSDECFWWDALGKLLLEHRPEHFVVFDDDALDLHLEMSPEDGDRLKQTRHLQTWRILKAADSARRQGAMSGLASALGLERTTNGDDGILTYRQLSALKGTALALGAHTMTHPSLPGLDPAIQRREIIDSRDACHDLAGSAPLTFSYPFGDYDDDCARIVKEAGFSLAVTVDDGFIDANTSAWKIPRIGIHGQSGEKIAKVLA